MTSPKTTTVYHLKTCDTCRKAIAALRAAGLEPTLIDVRDDGISPDVLSGLIARFGIDKVLNKRSRTWLQLDPEKKQDVDDARAVALIGEYPTLLKRPVISDGETVTIGWAASSATTWTPE